MKKKKKNSKNVASRCPKCVGSICRRYEVCLANYRKQIKALEPSAQSPCAKVAYSVQ